MRWLKQLLLLAQKFRVLLHCTCPTSSIHRTLYKHREWIHATVTNSWLEFHIRRKTQDHSTEHLILLSKNCIEILLFFFFYFFKCSFNLLDFSNGRLNFLGVFGHLPRDTNLLYSTRHNMHYFLKIKNPLYNSYYQFFISSTNTVRTYPH